MIKTDIYQAGLSATATNNFTLVTDAAGGSKYARGNAGATTQDIWTVDASGNVTIAGGTLSISNDAAWTTAAATFSPATGAFTSASGVLWWKRFGKTVFINASLTITTNGTGGNAVNLTVPFACPNGAMMTGRADAVSGSMLQGVLKPGTSVVNIFTYNNSYPGANGEVLRISGVYETT